MLMMAIDPAKVPAAQEQADQIIQSRIADFREIGTAYKDIADELKSPRPNVLRMQESAALIKRRGADMLSWFPPGSEPPAPKSWVDKVLGWFSSNSSFTLPSEAKSHAKPAVWSQRTEFEQAHEKVRQRG
jgi:cytochrome c556